MPTRPMDGAATGSISLVKLLLTAVLFVLLAGAGQALYGGFGALAGAGIAVLVYFSVVINQEYERAVVFRLGGFSRVLGPGFNVKLPFLEWVAKIDYRVKTANVQPQKVLTKDNVTVTVDAIIFYQVKREDNEVKNAVLEVEDYNQVTINYGKTMLRAEIGKINLDDLLQHREEIAEDLRSDLDDATNDFGVHIRDVEIRDVSIPDQMERAMAAEAEAERNRRAKIKEAKGELQAAVEMRAASDIMGKGGYQLRVLETLDNVAQENSTIVTIPTELIGGSTAGEDDGDSPVRDLVQQVLDDVDAEKIMNDPADLFPGDT